MCWVCDEYGNGTRWYFNPLNHARYMYNVKRPADKYKDYGTDPEAESGKLLFDAMNTRLTDPEKFKAIVKDMNRREMAFPKGPVQLAQTVTLEEAKQICDIAYPIAGLSCACRRLDRAQEETNEHEYSCTGLGVGMFKWERWPERYKGGVHFMDATESKEWLEKWDRAGFVHILMTFGKSPAGGPYVGGICNCSYPDCISIRGRIDYGLEINCLKSHYVAKVDFDLCNGCGVCAQRCQFGALKFEVVKGKPNIDAFKCFGCALCYTGCPTNAISLVERVKLPALKEAW